MSQAHSELGAAMQTHSPDTQSTPVLSPTPGFQDDASTISRAQAWEAGGLSSGPGPVLTCSAIPAPLWDSVSLPNG